MKHFKKIFFALCFLLLTSVSAQVNLVLNPSFEDLYSYPNNAGLLYLAKHWNKLDSILIVNSQPCWAPTLFSNYCTVNNLCGNPYGFNNTDYQFPRTGKNMAAAEAYTLDTTYKRDYLHGHLTQPLQVSKQYCITYYINLENQYVYAVNHFGLYLDNGQYDTVIGQKGIFTITPQIDNTTYVLLNDTLSWMRIQGVYSANGTESYVTIGNFSNDVQSNITQVNTGMMTDAFYNIDDISIVPIDLAPNAGKDTSITLGDSAYIGRPREVGLDDDCIWYLFGNSTPFDTLAGLWVKPNTLGTHSYVVEQNICGTVSYDTVVVTVNPVGIEQFKNKNAIFKIYPNPATNQISLNAESISNYQNSTITIQNTLGQAVKKLSFTKDVPVSELSPGVYFLQITVPSGETYKTKFIKQ